MSSIGGPRLALGRLVATAVSIVLVWIAVGLFFAWQHHGIMIPRGPADLPDRILAMVASMLVWALFTPIVVYVADAFPLRMPHLVRNTVLMILAVPAIAALRASCDVWLPWLLDGIPPGTDAARAAVVALFHTHVLFTIVIIGGANFLRLGREERDRQRAQAVFEARMAESRLRRLRSDLDPHFLFNALNGVVALVHQDTAAARRMLDCLGDLLQQSLASQDTREVLLRDELEFIARYLEIQKMRFGDRLSFSIEVASPELKQVPLPPLLLQPLVENAIVHGISRLPHGGRVVVHVNSDGRTLRVQVRDNGPGCDPERIFAGSNGRIGVSNARARLEAIYGNDQRLRYMKDASDFVAEVTIPIRAMQAQQKAMA